MTGESDLPQGLATRADDLLHTRPNAGQLAGMTTAAFEASGLDHDTLVLVWLAALVALDAPTDSYLMNLGAASQTAVSVERVHQVLRRSHQSSGPLASSLRPPESWRCSGPALDPERGSHPLSERFVNDEGRTAAATAFSPTDVPPSTQRAELTVAGQSMASLIVIAQVASRAVNVLERHRGSDQSDGPWGLALPYRARQKESRPDQRSALCGQQSGKGCGPARARSHPRGRGARQRTADHDSGRPYRRRP